MAKATYLELVNKILKRIGNTELSSGVSTATGTTAIIAELINESQIDIFNEWLWYSLYKTRDFNTAADTIEYSLASDFGKGIDLINITSNWVMSPAYIKELDLDDPNSDNTGSPINYTLQGDSYRISSPIPDGVYTIRDRYYKIPATLSSDSDTSDLPVECENCIFLYALTGMKEFKKEFAESDRYRGRYNNSLKKAKQQNNSKLNKRLVMRSIVSNRYLPLCPPDQIRGFTGF